MTNPETIERVRELRQRGRTPKEIARALGLPPAAVAPLIRAVAAAQPTQEAALVGCWVSQGWAAGLTVAGHRDWPGVGATAESGESGLVNILVAREVGSSVSVCGYLVDAWCLGSRTRSVPKSVDRRKAASGAKASRCTSRDLTMTPPASSGPCAAPSATTTSTTSASSPSGCGGVPASTGEPVLSESAARGPVPAARAARGMQPARSVTPPSVRKKEFQLSRTDGGATA